MGSELAEYAKLDEGYGSQLCVPRDDVIFVGDQEGGIRVSYDKGKAWKIVNGGMPDTVGNNWDLGIMGIEADSKGFVYVYNPKGLYKSTSIVTNMDAVPLVSTGDGFSIEVLPNPFNPSTTIHYTVPNPSSVEVFVYNLQGHLIRTLHTGLQGAGIHRATWNGKDQNGLEVSSGTYIVRLKAGDRILTKKLALIR